LKKKIYRKISSITKHFQFLGLIQADQKIAPGKPRPLRSHPVRHASKARRVLWRAGLLENFKVCLNISISRVWQKNSRTLCLLPRN
jgi:hypothetical protein